VSVRATIQDDTTKIQESIGKMAPSDELLSECLRLQKPREGRDEEEELSWKHNPLHGMYHQQIQGVADIAKSYQLLEKAGLKHSTDALIIAAQEQSLSTRARDRGSTTSDRTPGVCCAKRLLRQSST